MIFLGNKCADVLAGKSAKSPLDLNVVRRYFEDSKLISDIQLRLATILCHLPARPKQKTKNVPKIGLRPLEEHALSSRHSI